MVCLVDSFSETKLIPFGRQAVNVAILIDNNEPDLRVPLSDFMSVSALTSTAPYRDLRFESVIPNFIPEYTPLLVLYISGVRI